MNTLLQYLPEIDLLELHYVQSITQNMSESELQQFAMLYRTRRKDPTMILILAMIGLTGFAGIHRFVTGRVGLGIVYFLTCGFFFIGTIVDMFNHRELAAEYNNQQAYDVVMLMRRMGS